jgi:hypothetical protein
MKKTTISTILTGVLIGTMVTGCNPISYGCKAQQTIMKEIDPDVLLRKYMWYKDASASLDAKAADIRVYETRIKDLQKDYEGEKTRSWTREDRQQLSIWRSEVAGVKASFNSLAAEYNAQMAKINWAFCNIGELPKGADKPLPREYKPYIIE